MKIEEKLAAMLNFALLHDWGRNAIIPSNCEALHIWDAYSNKVVVFRDMQSLRAWAGY